MYNKCINNIYDCSYLISILYKIHAYSALADGFQKNDYQFGIIGEPNCCDLFSSFSMSHQKPTMFNSV